MDYQTAFNVALGLSTTLIGWYLRVMWESQRDLQAADYRLASKVSEMEVVVAGEYVKRNELERLSSALFAKLDRIEDKLSTKQDK